MYKNTNPKIKVNQKGKNMNEIMSVRLARIRLNIEVLYMKSHNLLDLDNYAYTWYFYENYLT
jgi:hypothetical protein